MRFKTVLHDFSFRIPFLKKLYIKCSEKKNRFMRWKTIVLPLQIKKRANRHMVFLVMTPEHRNFGDHAIAKAEQDLFEEKNICYVEVTGKYLEELRRMGWLNVFNKSPIFLSGGGYLGTLWLEYELLLRDIIKCNSKSPIVLLPNTIYYDESESGARELGKSVEIYNSHESLCIYARESYSYEFMKDLYKEVYLMPDMVLSLNECKKDIYEKRDGCIICLRHDCEKTLTKAEESIILNQIRKIFADNISFTDMMSDECIPTHKRDSELSKKFEQFRSAKLVITDRLHGMIFCAITGTPCIVINSKSPKVKGCYRWIENLEYIKFADDLNSIAEIYEKIPEREFMYDNSSFKHYYDELGKKLKSIAG